MEPNETDREKTPQMEEKKTQRSKQTCDKPKMR